MTTQKRAKVGGEIGANGEPKKTGWFIRKGEPSRWENEATNFYPVYVFEDGDERTYAEHRTSVEDCRRVIRDHFDNGRKAPERHTRMTTEEMADALHRTCLSDPF